ncbi:trypsin-like serine protease [Streptomyces sp. NBC_01465]
MRIAVPVLGASLAAGVAGVMLMAPANASATPLPTPISKPAVKVVPQSELLSRVAGATAGDSTPGAAATPSATPSPSSTSKISPKIIGGTTTTVSTAPWMAQLWYYDDKGTTDTTDDEGFFCGGTVVSPTKILTAAHCVKGYDWKNNGAIVTGTATLASGDTLPSGAVVTGIWRQWNHPSYKVLPSGAVDNDVAVLTLNQPVKATPINITKSDDTTSYRAGTSGTVYGWGRTSSTTQDISDTLRKATLPIDADTACTGFYGSDFVKGHQLCVGNPATGSDTGTVTACNGDSGGPLVVGGKIVGVVSYGVTDCVEKGAYGVFSKVSTFTGAVRAAIDDSNLNDDNKADLFTRRSSDGTGFLYYSLGTKFTAKDDIGDWNGLNLVVQTDLDRDGVQDLIYRVSSTGDVYRMHYDWSADQMINTKIATNWKTRKQIYAPGDVTGDGLPDLLSVDSAGVNWIYPGKNDGTTGPRIRIGGGWQQFNQLRGHGDLTGDGKTDLLARTSDGSVYLYRGTGNAASPFLAKIKVRSWAGFNTLDMVGDITGDGKADLIARKPSGTLYLYPGTGKASSEIFATPITIGNGWQQYGLLS